MRKSTFNPETILALEGSDAQQEALIDAFNQAIQEQDYPTARYIAELAIGDIGEEDLSFLATSGFAAHLWSWLYAYLLSEYSESEDGSEAEEKCWEAVLETLWKGKWILVRLPNDLSLSKAEIEEHSREISARYEELELGDSLHKSYLTQAIKMGDVELARQYFTKWQAAEEDKFADCEACQQDSLVEFYHFVGDYAKAAEFAEPILNGTMSCGEVPHISYYPAIHSLICLGRIEEAKQHLEKAVALISSEITGFAHIMSKLIQLHTLLGDDEGALALLKTHMDAISKKVVPANRLHLLEYLFAVAPYNEEAQKNALGLAKELDERNGNQYYQLKAELMFLPAGSIH